MPACTYLAIDHRPNLDQSDIRMTGLCFDSPPGYP